MINNIILIVVFYFSLISLSCVSRQSPAPVTKEPEARAKSVDSTVTQESWERDWQKTLAAAKVEGKLIIYNSPGAQISRAISEVFKEKFGVDIEWTSGRAIELAAKISRERGGGIYLADLFLGGAPTQINYLKPAGVLEPIKPLLVLPEVLDEKVWYGSRLPFADREQSYIISFMLFLTGSPFINITMVKPEDINSWNNLLESRWKGKIVFFDPTIEGPGAQNFHALSAIMGLDFMRKLAANIAVSTRDERLATEWAAHGKYPILMGTTKDIPTEFIKEGAPLKKITPREGTHLSRGNGTMAFINRAPHPNAARVFINWFLSKEGSYFYSRISNLQTARGDVPIDHLPPEEVRDPAIKYIIVSDEEFTSQRPAYIEKAKEIFGPLLK